MVVSDAYMLALIGFIAVALLVADRMLRINPILAREGFQIPGQPQRCGVDLPPCAFPLRCMNGFCYSDTTPQLYDRNPLPVTA